MVDPALETIASQSLNYDDLPETWRVPEIGRFSTGKTLYDYQIHALQNAARALFLYYEQARDWTAGESPAITEERKEKFARLYDDHAMAGLRQYKRYESPADEKKGSTSQVFRILSDFISPEGDVISCRNLINRMCFWMATGSGKTLVMVKLIEYLYCLIRHREIPPHNLLVLAPSEHLIGQIRRTVDEFNNQAGLYIDLVPLRDSHRARQGRLDDWATVYYHRSDNMADVQKEALTNYRTYENGGKWYVLLDEAHKGGKEGSRRQAYYALMAREGFLFNFSATFTDTEDIVTTVKKYNLKEFVQNRHGKNIYLNKTEYTAFQNREEEISHDERLNIVLKSLITLAYVSIRVRELRNTTGLEDMYHRPLMLTLVNSVNTDIEMERNDLWAFFEILRILATGEIDESRFQNAKNALMDEWTDPRFLFEADGQGIIGIDDKSIKTMQVADLREAVFLSRGKGALQTIRSSDNKELALQLKNADAPFALIRIGDTSKWRQQLLAGYEETQTLHAHSFFDGLEKNTITILMGSRSFFESWDSNRPNVINFINIGGADAKKFVVQSVGRGVRIETLPGYRGRLARVLLLGTLESGTKHILEKQHARIQPPETLFLFATNHGAVDTVLKGLAPDQDPVFARLDGVERAPVPRLGCHDMPLLIPTCRKVPKDAMTAPFSMSQDTLRRLTTWLEKTSDSVLAVRDGLAMTQIAALRGMVEPTGRIRLRPDKHYAILSFLQNRLLSHLATNVDVPDGVRELRDHDIVHFREIRVHADQVQQLQDVIQQVKDGRLSDAEMSRLCQQRVEGEITREYFDRRASGKDEGTFRDLTIKTLLGHYYLPVVLGKETAQYIQHIIKVESERKFLTALEQWTSSKEIPWEAWMFSKLDESTDKVYIPYFDELVNDSRRFMPDFVFWMCREREYRIVFVDPKSTEYTSAYRKIDGYQKLFVQNGKARIFPYRSDWQISVSLFFYQPDGHPADAYREYWIKDPGPVFN